MYVELARLLPYVLISDQVAGRLLPVESGWFICLEQANDGVSVDVASSFYCGDAAGREANWAPGKKKDHSSADRLLAHNLGLSFYTPEEYFLAQRPALYKEPEFQPKTLEESGSLLDPTDAALASTSQEVNARHADFAPTTFSL